MKGLERQRELSQSAEMRTAAFGLSVQGSLSSHPRLPGDPPPKQRSGPEVHGSRTLPSLDTRLFLLITKLPGFSDYALPWPCGPVMRASRGHWAPFACLFPTSHPLALSNLRHREAHTTRLQGPASSPSGPSPTAVKLEAAPGYR